MGPRMKTAMNDSAPIIAATATEGLTVTLADGRRARLAVIDDAGTVVACDGITRQAFDASCRAYRNFLQGCGHIRAVAANSADGPSA